MASIPTIKETALLRSSVFINWSGKVAGDRDFEIEFLDPGVQAFAVTFG